MNTDINITIITRTGLGQHLHFQTTSPDNKADIDCTVYRHLSARANELNGEDFYVTLFLGMEAPIGLDGDEVYENLADYEIFCDEQFGPGYGYR